MKVLQVTPYYAPAYGFGGPPRVVYELSEALAALGNEVVVLTTDSLTVERRIIPRLAKNGVEVHYFPNLSNYLAARHLGFLPIGLSRFMRKRIAEFDVIHLHEFRTYQNVIVHRQSLRKGVPYVLSAHGSIPRIVRKLRTKVVFDKIFGTAILGDASKMIAVSSVEVSQYLRMGVPPSKVSVIHNGIDPKEFELLPAKGTFAHAAGIGDRKVITYLGRVNRRKGLDVLVRAFTRLASRRSDIALVLAGPDDGYRRTLERLIRLQSPKAPVVQMGFLDSDARKALLVDSDVVVYTGSHEIFGLVPFEALLCGTPVIVADDSGCGLLIQHARAGMVVPFGDEQTLCEAIATTLERGRDVQTSVTLGREFVLRELNWRAIASETELLYESVARHDG